MADTAVAGTVAVDFAAVDIVAVGRAAVAARLAGTAVDPSADRVVSVPLAGTAADLPGDIAQGMMDMVSDPQTGREDTESTAPDIAVRKADTVLLMDTARTALLSKQASFCTPSHHQQLSRWRQAGRASSQYSS